MSPTMQNGDGSYSEATPLGWQGSGIDWEVYTLPDHAGFKACGYDEDVLCHVLMAATKPELHELMRMAVRV